MSNGDKTEAARPRENGAAPASADKQNTRKESGGGDPVSIYLRQMSRTEMLSEEEELDLSRRIQRKDALLRTLVCGMGFVAGEHLKILEECTADNIESIFMPSATAGKTNPETMLLELPEWRLEIKTALEKLENELAGGRMEQAEDARRALAGILTRHPLTHEHTNEWIEVALEYRKKGESTEPSEFDAFCRGKFLMTASELDRLLGEMQRTREELDELKKTMLTANLRLVVNVAKRFQSRGMQLGDLIQEGNLGLMKALDKFDYNLGNKFVTYATWWIKQAVSRAIANQSRVIRLPSHMISTISRMNNAEQLFIQEHGREPEADELAARLELPRERVSAIKKMACQSISLQATTTPEGDTSLEDILSDNGENNPSKKLATKVLREKVREALSTLTEREQQIISLRFGLGGDEPKTLSEASEHFNLTKERVRQIEIRTMEKLRDPSRKKYFDGMFPW